METYHRLWCELVSFYKLVVCFAILSGIEFVIRKNITIAFGTLQVFPQLTMQHHVFMQVHMEMPQVVLSRQPLKFNVVEIGQFDV